MWVHICFCALHGEAACQLEATTLEELFLSLADGEEACSDLWRCSVFVSTLQLSYQATEARSLSPKKAAVWLGGWRVCQGWSRWTCWKRAFVAQVVRWNSYGSPRLPAMSICRNSCTGCSPKWRILKRWQRFFPLQRLFIPSWTAYWHVTWISIKLLATRGHWKHDLWAALSICMVFARLARRPPPLALHLHHVV